MNRLYLGALDCALALEEERDAILGDYRELRDRYVRLLFAYRHRLELDEIARTLIAERFSSPTCHLCRRERDDKDLEQIADGRRFCRSDVVGCLHAARLALGIPKWQAAKAKGDDVERMRQARRRAA